MTQLKLPAPGFPMLTRMVSERSGVEAGDGKDPLTWIVGQAHPVVPDLRVVRMFVDRGGVEVYALANDGENGVRNLIPMHRVRFVEEAMPTTVFVDELEAAESDADDDDNDEGDPEGGEEEEPRESPPNGQATP